MSKVESKRPSNTENKNSNLKQTPITCPGHTRPVVFLDFSKIADSQYYLISASKDGKPMLRQGNTGDWIGTFEGHKDSAVWGVGLNSKATKAASAAADFQAILWDALTGDQLHSFQHKHVVKTVDFTSDDNQLVTGSNEKLLRIFDLNNYNSDPKVLTGHTGYVKQAIFLNNNRIIASIADDRSLRFWESNSGQLVKKFDLNDHATSLESTSDGETITISYGKSVSFWNANTLEKIKEYSIPTVVNSASMHSDKKSFVCGGEDFKIYKFDYDSGRELESFKGHFGPVHCVRFSPDGELYASGSEDGTLRLWQTIVGNKYGLWNSKTAEK